MKHVFLAVFDSVWKRKETKIFLAFSLYPLVYFIASFFGNSNFMQIASGDGAKLGYIDFADLILNSMDMMILPTLALYFLTISVFKRELDDHTMFLYKDINRKTIYFSKYFSLLIVLVIYFGMFLISSLIVYYTRVSSMNFGTTCFWSESLYYTFVDILSIFTVFLKGILSISLASFLSVRLGTGATMTTAIVLSLAMMVTSVIGGPIAVIFPNGYNQFVTSLSTVWIGFIGPLFLTFIYSIIFNHFSWKKFKSLEF
ncbi:hypothetical protein [Streptococcus lutetiensis]|uniref:hypothetical protein n=1 Tax=Streptococcus lutetiensis TaxID=150055 RepID=UPI001964101F|nr:hypothetical protein [Streptococcus lutetiensis]